MAHPGSAAEHNHLGVTLLTQGRLGEAVASLQQALHLKPDYPEAHNNLGVALLAQGKFVEAAARLLQAAYLKPDSAETHFNLGNAFKGQGKFEEALASYKRALRLKPDYPGAHNNLGTTLAAQGRLPEAVASYGEALRLKPDYGEAHNNLGMALLALGKPEQATASLLQAVRLKPSTAETHYNLALALVKQGKPEEALASYEQALRLKPDYAEAHKGLGQVCLLRGDYERGWQEYEWRLQIKDLSQRSFAQPRWDGSYLEGNRILLHAEQGLSDSLQFIRYAPLVQQRGGVVLVECPASLVPLLRRCPGVAEVIPRGANLPAFAVHAPLPSLPGIFRTGLQSVPASVPYLSADPCLLEQWRDELCGLKGLKVGLVWQEARAGQGDPQRSVPLAHFAPLAQLPDVRLVSLQKGPGAEQLAALAEKWGVLDLGARLDENGTFMDTAAVLQNLDLVVTTDTALAHLAGALGVPVWAVLGYAPDWRWLLERTDSPWYPTMQLFRQRRWEDWDIVCERLARELEAQRTGRPFRKPILAELTPGELLDRITALEIQREQVRDDAQLGRIRVELGSLLAARARCLKSSANLECLLTELRGVNARLREIEDAIRRCEPDKDAEGRFAELARFAYQENERRAALQRAINDLFGSRLAAERPSA